MNNNCGNDSAGDIAYKMSYILFLVFCYENKPLKEEKKNATFYSGINTLCGNQNRSSCEQYEN